MEQHTGEYLRTIFKSQLNGFTVCIFLTEVGQIKCVGTNLPEAKKIKYKLNGTTENDKTGKKQFVVTSFCEQIDNSKNGILTFLSSGTIKGIGKVTAKLIVDHFGDQAMDVIAHTPEKLICIRGISEKKIEIIKESYTETHLPLEVIELLMPLGFSLKTTTAIYKRFHDNTVSILKENPYRLCEVRGVGFIQSDRLGRKLNIDSRDNRRMTAAISEALKYNFFEGKVGCTKADLILLVAKITGLNDTQYIWQCILNEIKTEQIDYRKLEYHGNILFYLYSKNIKTTEELLAEHIMRCTSYNMDRSRDISQYLSDKEDVKFDESQLNAIKGAFTNSLSIITGGPGTGKTTIIKKIADINDRLNPHQNMYFLAPTGKAARRISQSTGYMSQTVHSCFHIKPQEDDVYLQESPTVIENSLIIVDEFSMVDMMLAYLLFKNTQNCRIVIIGDADQLQSVGAGNVLKDMIASGKVPSYRLTYEHRQQDGSTINDNANGMQRGLLELKESEDFHCHYTSDSMEKLETAMVDEYLSYHKDPNINDVVCLCPYKKYACGSYSVNNRLQEILNPLRGREEFKGDYGMSFRVGDPVMHIKTNNEQVSNGNVGEVEKIGFDEGVPAVFVKYDLGNKIEHVSYTIKEIDQLSLSYAMTVHKSQGSEYDAVVTCLTKFHKMMLKRNILYTAITRAKLSVSCFSDSKDTIRQAIENDSTDDRNTLLEYLLETYNKDSKAKVVVKHKKSKQCAGQMAFA